MQKSCNIIINLISRISSNSRISTTYSFINPALIIYSFSQFQIRFMVEHLGVLGVACIQLQIPLLPHVGASSNLTFSITLHIGPRAFVTMAATEQGVGREVGG